MSNKKILIVEDEPIIAADLELTLESMGYNVVGIEDNAEDALISIEENSPDLILLDINLEGDIDGIMLAQDINNSYKIPFVFLTSNADKLTINRVKRTQPAGFIVKPFNEKDLLSNIEIALFSSKSNDNQDDISDFFVKDGTSLIKLNVSDILFIRADDNYSRVFTIKRNYILSKTLKSIEEKLPSSMFMRVHRSFIVNLNSVDKIKENTIYIDKHSIPISRTYTELLFQKINKL